MEQLSMKRMIIEKWGFFANINKTGYTGNANLTIIYEEGNKVVTGYVELYGKTVANFSIPTTQEHCETIISYIKKAICWTESMEFETEKDFVSNLETRFETLELVFEDFWDDEKDESKWNVKRASHTMKERPKFNGIQYMKDHGCSDEDIKDMLVGDEVFVEKSGKFKLGDVVLIENCLFSFNGKIGVILAIDWNEDCEIYNIALRLDAGEMMWANENDCSKIEESKNA